MKKYYADRKTITITIGFFLALYVFSSYVQEIKKETFSQLVFWSGTLGILVIPMAFGVLLATKYSHASISDTTLKFVYLLFYRRTILIGSITDINDQPTYKVAKGAFRSLYIFYKDKSGETKWIELRITIFPEKTLGRLINDLKEINPHIELNPYAEKLMRSASRSN